MNTPRSAPPDSPSRQRVVLPGAAGRMGKLILRELLTSNDLLLVAASEAPGHPALGQDVSTLVGHPPCGVLLADDLTPLLEAARADVLIDFTLPTLSAHLAAHAAAAGTALVIGTTGIDEAQRAVIEDAATKVAVVFAPNMSVGVNVLLDLVTAAARHLGSDFDLEIVEAHHKHKRDAPSGTALRIAEALAAATPDRGPLETRACFGRQGQDPRRPGQIAIHTIRGGDVAGDHTIHFLGEGERLEITHRATTRATFARGALRAARWLAGRSPGLYTMRDVLGLAP